MSLSSLPLPSLRWPIVTGPRFPFLLYHGRMRHRHVTLCLFTSSWHKHVLVQIRGPCWNAKAALSACIAMQHRRLMCTCALLCSYMLPSHTGHVAAAVACWVRSQCGRSTLVCDQLRLRWSESGYCYWFMSKRGSSTVISLWACLIDFDSFLSQTFLCLTIYW